MCLHIAHPALVLGKDQCERTRETRVFVPTGRHKLDFHVSLVADDQQFGEALPPRLAEATLAARTADEEGAGRVLAEPVRFVTLSGSP